ncbi:MAG: hypothetical protein QM796_02985 [Chthoniobacteraceae bacterium]
MVTQGGEVLGSDGVASGGKARDTGNSVLQRKNQIAVLAEEAQALRAKQEALTVRRTETVGTIEAVQARLHEAREEKQNDPDAGVATARPDRFHRRRKQPRPASARRPSAGNARRWRSATRRR